MRFIMNKTLLIFSCFVFALSAKTKPNVLFILSDNQSYYELSCHGNTELRTPHLDRLANEGVDFQNLYAPNYCSPSRAEAMTGKYAVRTGVYDTLGGRSILHKDHQTIADIMKANGYKTSMYGKWHLGYSFPYRPQDRGFDETFMLNGGCLGQIEDYFGNDHIDPVFIHNGKKVNTKGFSTDVLFNEAMKWIEGLEGQPFFCFLSTPAVHGPFQSPDGKKGAAALKPMIENVDMNVGRMMAKLKILGIDDNTIVIFASDQGMFDRGAHHLGKKKENSQDAKQHIPFILRVPGAKSSINTDIAGMHDFAPTVLDLCDLEIPSDMDGISLKALITGDKSNYPSDRTVIIQCPRGREIRKNSSSSVKTQRWRLDSRKLFDKKNDPRCRTDVSKQYPEVVKMLSEKYDEFWNSLPDPESTFSRNEIGDPSNPNIQMTAMDWYKGDKPWSQGHIAKVKKEGLNGVWAIKVLKGGTYTFELFHYPKESGKTLAAKHAKIQIGETQKEQVVKDSAVSISFTFELKEGDYDLETYLNDGAVEFGALYINIKKIN